MAVQVPVIGGQRKVLNGVSTIRESKQLEIIADPHRVAILRMLMTKPCRLTDLGLALDRHPAWIRHHILRLLSAGLVDLAEEKIVANHHEKWYRASAQAYAVNMLLTADTGVETSIVVLGSDDPILRELATEVVGTGITPVSIGSLDGLIALRQGLADMAGCHLIDPDTDEYNSSYVRRLLPERPSALVTLAHREQGLVTAPGNPLILSEVIDLAREDVRFAARNPGSGTRIWVDKQLRKAGVDFDAVYAGTTVAMTHCEAAETVARGQADATIAIRSAAEDLGLGFVPLFHERYDLVIPVEHLEDTGIARVVDQMQTRAFRDQVAAMPGYDATHTGEKELVSV